MITKRLSLIAIAAAFAVSSSAAMLQSSRPALADADDHHPRVHRPAGDHDRDDRRNHAGYHWANGQWVPNRVANNNGHWVNGRWVSNNWNGNPGKHKGWKHKKHDRDDRR